MVWGGGGLALPLPLALGLVWASGGGLFLATLEVAGLLLGGLWGGGGWVWGFFGGMSSPRWWWWCCCCCCWSPLPSRAPSPNPCAAGPCPPHSCLPSTYPTRAAPKGQIGVTPQHPAHFGDSHEVRPASAIAPLHAHPAGVGSTRLHTHNLRTELRGRCLLAAF